MPSSLVSGPKYTFFTVLKKLSVGSGAVVNLAPRTAPASGAVGDMYVTTGGVLKICTVAGTPGTWVSVGAQV